MFEETDSYISDTELDHLQSALKKIESQIDLPEETSPDQLVDLLIMISKIDPKDKYKIFQMTSVSDRLGKILDFH